MKSVRFKSRAWELAAILQFPENFDESKKYPAIVCAHPISSCKDQTASNLYGKVLAEAGYVTLAFDASHQGESGGEPRFLEDPATRVEDFRYAADYLTTLNYIDDSRIGVLGICGGGAYAINAAMTERRFKAVTAVVPANYGRIVREGDLSVDAALKTLEAVATQRTAEARGAEPMITQFIPNSQKEREEAGVDNIDVNEAIDYYKTPRGAHACSPNKLLFTSLDKAIAFDAFHLAEHFLTQPLLIIAGEKPGVFGSLRDAYEIHGKAASKNKELFVVPGVSHYDLYDLPKATGPALEKIVPFFKANL